MNKEQKERIDKCDAVIQSTQILFNSKLELLNLRIKSFGDFREQVILSAIGSFKKAMLNLNKKVNYEYLIPEEITISLKNNIKLAEVKFSTDKKWEIANNAATIFTNSANQLIKSLYSYKGMVYNPSSKSNNNDYGAGWLALVAAGIDILVAYGEKKEREESAVKKYESETKIFCEKISKNIVFFKIIDKRLDELFLVTRQLFTKAIDELINFEEIISFFNPQDPSHVNLFNRTCGLIEGLSAVSKVELLDSNNNLSSFDEKYIIKCRKLLSKS